MEPLHIIKMNKNTHFEDCKQMAEEEIKARRDAIEKLIRNGKAVPQELWVALFNLCLGNLTLYNKDMLDALKRETVFPVGTQFRVHAIDAHDAYEEQKHRISDRVTKGQVVPDSIWNELHARSVRFWLLREQYPEFFWRGTEIKVLLYHLTLEALWKLRDDVEHSCNAHTQRNVDNGSENPAKLVPDARDPFKVANLLRYRIEQAIRVQRSS